MSTNLCSALRLRSSLPIYAGDVARADIMKAAKGGEGAVEAEDRSRLEPRRTLGRQARRGLGERNRGLALRRASERGLRRHGLRAALSRRASGRRRVIGGRTNQRLSLSDRRHGPRADGSRRALVCSSAGAGEEDRLGDVHRGRRRQRRRSVLRTTRSGWPAGRRFRRLHGTH